MVNLISNSTIQSCQSPSLPRDGSFNGKRVINIDSSYLEKQKIGVGVGPGMLDGVFQVLAVLIIAAVAIAGVAGAAIGSYASGGFTLPSLASITTSITPAVAGGIAGGVLIGAILMAILMKKG